MENNNTYTQEQIEKFKEFKKLFEGFNRKTKDLFLDEYNDVLNVFKTLDDEEKDNDATKRAKSDVKHLSTMFKSIKHVLGERSSEGDHDQYELVYQMDDIYVAFYGSYHSENGIEFYDEKPSLVYPVVVTSTAYSSVNI